MSTNVKPIPEGYHAVTPYLILDDASAGIEFYKAVFGAVELMRIPAPGNKVGHAEMQIGDSRVMLADDCPEMDARGPKSMGGSPLFLMVYVADVDSTVAKALAAGARVLQPIENKFYGDRSGTVVDPFGHRWTIATHIEDVSEEELSRRMAALSQAGSAN